jgi:predicted rRNA methylase YqxC with S4 and FtsJ domains
MQDKFVTHKPEIKACRITANFEYRRNSKRGKKGVIKQETEQFEITFDINTSLLQEK